MIAVDTSALMAILGDEPEADACADALDTNERLLISAATMAEALIVAGQRDLGTDMAELIDRAGLEIVGVSPAAARRVAGAYAKWGKGVHPAALNFGDCFAYETAKTHDCPLLYIGGDFAQTDIASVL
ncbi:MAG: type II toxin-antitoxin system VapC family toxin [Rhodospirillaceae bacterium]|nr:type II toxin-antitoxin system VapC family toxin [Rhodospirillaceae bacterium]